MLTTFKPLISISTLLCSGKVRPVIFHQCVDGAFCQALNTVSNGGREQSNSTLTQIRLGFT